MNPGCSTSPGGSADHSLIPAGAGRAVVHGRGAGRAGGPPHPRLVPEGGAPARRAPAGVQLRPPVRGGVPGAGRGRRPGAARGVGRGRGRPPRRAVTRGPGREPCRAGARRRRPARRRGAGRAGRPDPAPPHSPALDPVERIREHPRDRRLGRRVLAGGHRPVVDAARAARDALPAGPAAPAGQPPLAARVRHHFVGPVFEFVGDGMEQCDEDVRLRLRLLLGDAVRDHRRAALDILDLHAGGLGERVELGLVPARRSVAQPLRAVDRYHAGSVRHAGGRRREQARDDQGRARSRRQHSLARIARHSRGVSVAAAAGAL